MLDYVARLPFWGKALIAFAGMAAVCSVASLLPNPWGVLFVILSAAVVAGLVWFDPKLRFSHRAGILISLWTAVRAISGITILIPTNDIPIYFKFGDDVPLLFDVVIGLLIGGCFLADYILRSGDIEANGLFPGLLNFTRIQNDGDRNQTIIVQGDNNTISTAVAALDFNANIDTAASFLKERQPDTTISMLGQLERHAWDKLSPRERYRLKANLGHAYNHKEEWAKAAGLYLEAEIHQPDDVNARSYGAAARWMLGKTEEALLAAEKLLLENPLNEIAMATRIRCQSEQISFGEIEREIPNKLKDSIDVLFALYQRARRNRDLSASLRLARRLNGSDRKDPQFRIALGEVLATYALDVILGRLPPGDATARAMATEAVLILDAELSEDVLGKVSNSQARYYRALAHEVLGELEKAESDFRSALQISPSDDELQYQFCIFLVRRDRDAHAIAEFAKIPEEKLNLDRAVLYSGLLQQSKSVQDRQKGVDLLTRAIDESKSPTASLAFEAVDTLSRAKAASGDQLGARIALARFGEQLTNSSRLVIEARLAIVSGSKEDAAKKASKAKKCLSDADGSFLLFYLAQVFAKLGMHSDATEVFKLANIRSPFFEVARTVIRSAWEADDIGFLIEYCQAFRQTGRFSYSVLETEIACYEKLNEHGEALRLIEEFINNQDLDSNEDERFRRYMRLKRSMIGWIVGRSELVESDASRLPNLNDVQGEDRALAPVIGASQLLVAGERPEVGWLLAYEIVRRYFGSHKAHGNLLCIAGPNSKVSFPEHDVVGADSAVAYREKKGDSIKWIVLEDGDSLDSTRHEISPKSTLGKELIGKTVGDEFYLRRGAVQDRVAEITAIVHKVRYRVCDSFQNWEEYFPDTSFVQSFNFTKEDGELDPDEMLRSLQQLDEPIHEVESLYRENIVSIGMFATLVGQGALESVFHLASKPEMPIRCCVGNPREYESARTSLGKAEVIIADPSALATLYSTGAFRKIKLPPDKFKISFATIHAYDSMLRDPESRLFSKVTLGTRNNRIEFNERTDNAVNDDIDRMQSFVDWLKESCKIVGGRGLLKIPPDKRGKLTQMFGNAMVESVAVAIDLNGMLWSDDLAITEFTADFAPVQRAWTQPILDHLAGEGMVSDTDRMSITIRLIEFGYRFIRTDEKMILFAARESRWDAESAPFSIVINWINTSGVAINGAVSAASFIVHSACSNAPLSELRMKACRCVCRALRIRPDALRALSTLKHHFTQSTRLTDAAKNECGQILAEELDLLEGRKRIILPHDYDFRSR